MHRSLYPLLAVLIFSSGSSLVGAKEQECYGNTWTPDDRFDLNNDIAYDKKTKLYWKRCAEGSKWNGSVCSGEPKTYLLREYLTEFNISGSDWRIPTIDELNSIKSGQVDGDEKINPSLSGCIRPAINLNIFPDATSPKDKFYGTSSMAAGYELDIKLILNGDPFYNTMIKCLDMESGKVCSAYSNSATDKSRIRLVRGKEYVGDYIKKKLAYTIPSKTVSKAFNAGLSRSTTTSQSRESFSQGFECRVACMYGNGVTAENLYTFYSVNASDHNEAKQKTKNGDLDKICKHGGYYQAAPSASFSMQCTPK